MYFDLDDYRPDVPRVRSAISRREAVMVSFLAHVAVVLFILFAPKAWFETPPQAMPAYVPPPEDEIIRYVDVQPLIERPAPPRPTAPPSDLDRRSATVVPPKPSEIPDPAMRGNTPDKVLGAPMEKTAGPPSAAPPSPNTAPPPPDNAVRVLPDPPAPPGAAQPPSGTLGDALRNLRQFLREQTYDNPQGGTGDQGPDIQFDSKGVDFGPWLRRFRAQVYRNWFVPDAAMFAKGHVVITFFVHRDGRITDLKVIGPSSIEAFNLSSFNALKLSNPTVPLPPDYPADQVFFTVTFHYNEGRGRQDRSW